MTAILMPPATDAARKTKVSREDFERNDFLSPDRVFGHRPPIYPFLSHPPRTLPSRVLPFGSSDSVSCSVKVTLIDDFKEEREFAGISLIDEGGSEFLAKQELVGGKLVFAPGKYVFKGLPGERGDPAKYDVQYTAATREAGPLRIIADRSNAFFQVGPSTDGKYLNFFHSAIRTDTKERGFALTTGGAPEKANHWVRFDDFKVVKH